MNPHRQLFLFFHFSKPKTEKPAQNQNLLIKKNQIK